MIASVVELALCRGRRSFATHDAVLADARERGLTVNRKMGAYVCGDCGLWHLERTDDGVLRRRLNPAYASELRKVQRARRAAARAAVRPGPNTRHLDAAPISPRSYS